jgi:hypothetical protein
VFNPRVEVNNAAIELAISINRMNQGILTKETLIQLGRTLDQDSLSLTIILAGHKKHKAQSRTDGPDAVRVK